jgi:hypothetical protein
VINLSVYCSNSHSKDANLCRAACMLQGQFDYDLVSRVNHPHDLSRSSLFRISRGLFLCPVYCVINLVVIAYVITMSHAMYKLQLECVASIVEC